MRKKKAHSGFARFALRLPQQSHLTIAVALVAALNDLASALAHSASVGSSCRTTGPPRAPSLIRTSFSRERRARTWADRCTDSRRSPCRRRIRRLPSGAGDQGPAPAVLAIAIADAQSPAFRHCRMTRQNFGSEASDPTIVLPSSDTNLLLDNWRSMGGSSPRAFNSSTMVRSLLLSLQMKAC